MQSQIFYPLTSGTAPRRSWPIAGNGVLTEFTKFITPNNTFTEEFNTGRRPEWSNLGNYHHNQYWRCDTTGGFNPTFIFWDTPPQGFVGNIVRVVSYVYQVQTDQSNGQNATLGVWEFHSRATQPGQYFNNADALDSGAKGADVVCDTITTLAFNTLYHTARCAITINGTKLTDSIVEYTFKWMRKTTEEDNVIRVIGFKLIYPLV